METLVLTLIVRKCQPSLFRSAQLTLFVTKYPISLFSPSKSKTTLSKILLPQLPRVTTLLHILPIVCFLKTCHKSSNFCNFNFGHLKAKFQKKPKRANLLVFFCSLIWRAYLFCGSFQSETDIFAGPMIICYKVALFATSISAI